MFLPPHIVVNYREIKARESGHERLHERASDKGRMEHWNIAKGTKTEPSIMELGMGKKCKE